MFKFRAAHFKWNINILRMIMALIKYLQCDWYGFNTFKTQFCEFSFSFFSDIWILQNCKEHWKPLILILLNVVENNKADDKE